MSFLDRFLKVIQKKVDRLIFLEKAFKRIIHPLFERELILYWFKQLIGFVLNATFKISTKGFTAWLDNLAPGSSDKIGDAAAEIVPDIIVDKFKDTIIEKVESPNEKIKKLESYSMISTSHCDSDSSLWLGNQLIKYDKSNIRGYYSKGIGLQNEKPHEAIHQFEKALRLNHRFLPAIYGKYECLRRMRKYDEAKKCIEELLKACNGIAENDEQMVEAYYYRILSLYLMKKYDEAKKCIEEALKAANGIADTSKAKLLKHNSISSYAHILSDEGKYAEAIQLYDLAMEIMPTSKSLKMLVKGNWHVKLNQYSEALKCYNYVIETLPANYQFCKHAALFKLDCLGQLNRINELIEFIFYLIETYSDKNIDDYFDGSRIRLFVKSSIYKYLHSDDLIYVFDRNANFNKSFDKTFFWITKSVIYDRKKMSKRVKQCSENLSLLYSKAKFTEGNYTSFCCGCDRFLTKSEIKTPKRGVSHESKYKFVYKLFQ